ncbi:TPA: DNA primase, partial [Legionella pneumophila]|nr:DNA primase [Legionella pneumophila]
MLAADDDKHLEQSKGINPGKEKAGQAAAAVNGFIVLPTFAPDEQASNPKHFSDFNDLANHSKLGIEGVKRQIKPKIDRIANRYKYLRSSQKNNVICIS